MKGTCCSFTVVPVALCGYHVACLMEGQPLNFVGGLFTRSWPLVTRDHHFLDKKGFWHTSASSTGRFHCGATLAIGAFIFAKHAKIAHGTPNLFAKSMSPKNIDKSLHMTIVSRTVVASSNHSLPVSAPCGGRTLSPLVV